MKKREEKLQKKRHFANSTLTAPSPPDCSQSPIFRKIVKIEGLPAQTAISISYVPRGRGSGLIIVPRPLIRFVTHPRWPPLT